MFLILHAFRWSRALGLFLLAVGAVGATLLFSGGEVRAQDKGEQPNRDGRVAQAPRVKVALVIGNAAYRSLAQLKNARNDAMDVCAAIQSIGFEAICIFDVATRGELREAIRAFAAKAGAERGAETFFFYAGHGIQVRGENYLMPTDSQIWSDADVDFEGVGLSYLLSSLEQARSYPNVIVLDACRDNPFGDNSRVRVEKGLARIDPPVGTVLAYATAPNKTALDGSGTNGLFTKHLLMRLTVAGLQLDEMFRSVSNAVEDEARTAFRFEQVPYRSSSYSASYCLAGCEDPKLMEQARTIEAQWTELNRKLQEMSDENERLKIQAGRGADEIAKLESRVARLLDEKAKGTEVEDVGKALDEARSELESVKADQARWDALEKDNQRRIVELKGLREELGRQAIEIEEYQKKIRDLESARVRSTRPEENLRSLEQRPRRPGVIVPNF